jgi:NDP-4-keto-2,6-dideoxyhexose 3-C-methyltransferase
LSQTAVDDRVRTHDGCRVCGGPLESVLDFGSQYLQGCFVKPGVSDPPTTKFPMELTRCVDADCGLVQLRHTLAGELLYDVYWYRSRINATMRDHLGWIADSVTGLLGRAPGRVLDIGCNDGTLLRRFADSDRWGVDPSSATDDVPEGINVIRDFFPSEAPELRDGTFDAVTSIAMFYDVEQPVEFARRVERLLAPNGVWVVEVAHLPDMIIGNAYDGICHEHLAYYSLGALRRVLDEAGLTVVRASTNSINGGSLCAFVTRAGETRDLADGSVEEIVQREKELDLTGTAVYRAFADRVRAHRDDVRELLLGVRERGEVVHVYGASTKGNTLLQFCGVDRDLVPYAAERNPDKVGARTLGTDIEIVSEEESRAAKPDYYLVLPWHFRAEILKREADTIAAGCKLIFPLPSLDIVG